MSLGSEHFCGAIPLRAARQNSATDPLTIFFRGYLTNQTELALQVGLEYPAARSAVDVIGASYARWGRSLPAVLEGQFALVIADRRTGDALLVRDALGVVPLYWSLTADTVRFATKVRDLVDSNARNDLNLKEVRRFILFGATSNDTVYSAIKRLDPRTSVWIHNGSIAHNVAWDPRAIKPVIYKQASEYVDHFVDLVDASVKGSVRDSGSAWISLSGGVDSNTVLPPAARYCPNLRAFSIVAPQWPEEDESKWIERIVTARRLPWHPINAEEILPFSDFPETFCGSPDAGVIHQRFRTVLNQLVGANVFLTGDGGDSFMGSQMGPVPSHLADPIFNGDRSGLLRDLVSWRQQSRPMRSKAYWFFHALMLPSMRHVLRRSVRPPHYHLHPPWLSFGKRLRFGSRAPQPRSVAPRCRTPGQQAILDDLWQCAEDPAFDRLYASRHPLFNRPLFEFLWAIPWSQKCLPLCDRYLQRRALKGLIDDDIRTRIGYGIGTKAFVEGLRRSNKWKDYLCESPKMAELGLVDSAKWRQAIQQASVGLTKAEPLLVRAIGVEVWLKQLSQFCR